MVRGLVRRPGDLMAYDTSENMGRRMSSEIGMGMYHVGNEVAKQQLVWGIFECCCGYVVERERVNLLFNTQGRVRQDTPVPILISFILADGPAAHSRASTLYRTCASFLPLM